MNHDSTDCQTDSGYHVTSAVERVSFSRASLMFVAGYYVLHFRTFSRASLMFVAGCYVLHFRRKKQHLELLQEQVQQLSQELETLREQHLGNANRCWVLITLNITVPNGIGTVLCGVILA